MKINNFRPVNMNPYNKQMEKQDQLQSSKKKDKIEISPEALELQRGNQLEMDRHERVNELKNKVQSGEYKVNPEEIAHKMNSFWDDLKKWWGEFFVSNPDYHRINETTNAARESIPTFKEKDGCY